MADNSIQLGFLEKTDAGWLESRFFPSKVGGRPAWMDPQMLPSALTLTCGVCKDPMSFLLQQDAQKSFRVLRGQLPEHSPFYATLDDAELDDAEEVPEEDTDSEAFKYRMKHRSALCAVCGAFAEKKCGACLRVHYCSLSHQKLHWTFGKHSKICKQLKEEATAGSSLTSPLPAEALQPWIVDNPALFSEYEVVSEPEAAAKLKKQAEDEEKHAGMLKQYYQEMEEENQSGAEKVDIQEDDLPQNSVDEQFVKFQTVIDVDSSQVLRFTSEPGEAPLWMCSKGMIATSEVPPCGICGAERIFELQILPQLIYHLKVERNAVGGDPNNDSIDWGVLAIYTCKNSCDVPKGIANSSCSGSYAVEHLHSQLYE